MTTMERYQKALRRIGGAGKLLSLPEQVREVLMSTEDLSVKTEMLELIAEALKK